MARNTAFLPSGPSHDAFIALTPMLRPPLMHMPHEGELYPYLSIDDLTAHYYRWGYCEQIYAWLRNLQHVEYVLIDTETTGSRRFSEVIEVAILSKQGDVLFHSLLQPSTPIEPIVTSVHGLTWKDVKDAPPFDACSDNLYQSMQGKLVLGYNVSFDIRLLFQTARAFQIPFPAIEAACLMSCYSKMRGERSPGGQYRRFPLAQACLHMQIPVPTVQFGGREIAMLKHRALDDARLLYELLQRLTKAAAERKVV